MPLRVLLVAENASTRWGGEAILPHHYFRVLLQRGVDVHLIVHERCREELDADFAAHRSRLVYIADTTLQRWFHALSRHLPRRISESSLGLANQMMTQRAQRRVLRRMAAPDTVVHQPIPVAPRFPSAIFNVGAPVVIGPMNGGMEYPPSFRAHEGWLSRLAIALGRSLSRLAHVVLPGKHRAAVLLVANERTRHALDLDARAQVLTLPENGVDLAKWTLAVTPLDPHVSSSARRFIFIGRLVDWKALDIALEAIAPLADVSLDVIGDGPMLAAWRARALALGLQDRVRFLGWRSQGECAELLHDAVGLVLPSLYECGGAVVLEAMACAKPVIATAWGGPVDYLDASCGFLVEPSSREALVAGFRHAMLSLLVSPELARRMGAAGRARVERDFDWECKVDHMLAIYESALTSVAIPAAARTEVSG